MRDVGDLRQGELCLAWIVHYIRADAQEGEVQERGYGKWEMVHVMTKDGRFNQIHTHKQTRPQKTEQGTELCAATEAHFIKLQVLHTDNKAQHDINRTTAWTNQAKIAISGSIVP